MAERKVFRDSVAPLPKQAGLTAAGVLQHGTKPDDMSERMTLHFALRPPADRRAQLEATVAAGGVVSPKAFESKFGVSEASVTALTDWLTAQGFTVDHQSPDRTSVYASAPLSVIEASLGVDIVEVTKEGVTYPAARNAPSLPAAVADAVHAIIGLQPYRRARKHLRRPVFEHGQADQGAGGHGYLVADLLRAYGADAVTATGAGQTIAILIDTVPDDGDLQAFWRANGLPADVSRITKVNVKGAHLPPVEGEETLDTEWASAAAPGADVRVYATGTLSSVSVARALDRIIADLTSVPSMRQLSISLGLGETYFGAATAEITTQHDKFLRLAAAGVNVFVSSGDAGSNPDVTGHSATGALQVEYQASDPCVVAVGGTTLRLAGDGSVAAETAWAGSGGGVSSVFPRPPWQTGANVPDGTQRVVPDVSLVADPRTGGMVVLHGRQLAIGGTSWAAPVWAAFCARVNEARQTAGKPLLGFLNPALYPLGGTASFRDVVSGSNGGYAAGPGYDMVTGLGTPELAALIEALA
jgi:kumamolisin